MALTAEEKAQKALDAQKAKDDKAAQKALDKKAREDAAAKVKAEKPQTVKQNGIARPNKGKTLRIWEIADQVSKDTKAPATRKDVTDIAAKEGLELGTIHTQYGRWRKFHGLTGQRLVNAAEKAAAKTADKAPADKPLTKAQQKAKDTAELKAAGNKGK